VVLDVISTRPRSRNSEHSWIRGHQRLGMISRLFFGDNFELAISSRSDGTTRKYFWRFRSSKRDRKYVRLAAVSIQDYLRSLDHEEVLHLKVLEEEIIYLNANLRLLKAMTDSIEQSENEIAELQELAV